MIQIITHSYCLPKSQVNLDIFLGYVNFMRKSDFPSLLQKKNKQINKKLLWRMPFFTSHPALFVKVERAKLWNENITNEKQSQCSIVFFFFFPIIFNELYSFMKLIINKWWSVVCIPFYFFLTILFGFIFFGSVLAWPHRESKIYMSFRSAYSQLCCQCTSQVPPAAVWFFLSLC